MSVARLSEPGHARPAPFFDQGIFLLHLNRGKLEFRRGNYEDARREFEDAQRLRPHDSEVRSNLAFTFFHLGLYAEAERLTRTLVEVNPTSVPLLFNLGLILLRAGEPAQAREALEKVLELAPDHRKAHLTLGLALQRLGDVDAARQHLRQAGADRNPGGGDDDTVSRTARRAAAVRVAEAAEAPPVKPESFDVRGEGPNIDTAPVTVSSRQETAAAAGAPAPEAALREPSPNGPQTGRVSIPAEPVPSAPVAAGASTEGRADEAPRSATAIPPVETTDSRWRAKTQPAIRLSDYLPGTAGAEDRQSPELASRAPGAARAATPFAVAAGGFLESNTKDGLLARRGVLTGRRGAPALTAETTLTGALSKLLVKASGAGTLLLVEKGRTPLIQELAGEFLSVDPARLLAFEESLSYREDPAFEFRKQIPLPFLKLYGEGAVALAVSSPPARFEVEPGSPLSLSASSVVAYAGDIVPELMEGFDPLSELGGGPMFRFSGSGYVLAEG